MQTAAGRCLNEGYLAKEKELQLQFDAMRNDLVEAKREQDEALEQDMENQKAGLMRTLARVEKDRRDLEVDIKRKSKEREKRIQNLAQQRQVSRSRSATAGAVSGLGMLGQAALAMAGEAGSGVMIMMRAVKLGAMVLGLVLGTGIDVLS